jgi:hypothetical protein
VAKPIPHKFRKKPIARAKGKKKLKFPDKKDRGWMIAGFDTSMSSLAGAAIAYDRTTKKMKGPKFVMRRWSKEDHYFDRLEMCARSHELIWDLLSELVVTTESEHIFIAQEEPIPLGMIGRTGKGQSGWMKQQAEISGAFLGGMLRYGYQNLFQMNTTSWRQMVAEDLGITIHHSKWQSIAVAEEFNSTIKDSGKFRTKQWAMNPGYAFMGGAFPEEIPDWPDIIESTKDGKIPRPEGSKARAVQPDDRYDALAIMFTLYLDLLEQGVLK